MNKQPLYLEEMVWVKVRLGNMKYVINFEVAENLAFEVIIATKLLKENLIEIRCLEKRVKLQKYTVPTLVVGIDRLVSTTSHVGLKKK